MQYNKYIMKRQLTSLKTNNIIFLIYITTVYCIVFQSNARHEKKNCPEKTLRIYTTNRSRDKFNFKECNLTGQILSLFFKSHKFESHKLQYH